LVNLLITMRCNRACSYCFAKEKLHSYSKQPIKDITLENFNIVLDFLLKSNQNVLQLAGGEPTIHPQFKEMLLTLINKKIRVNILSNALWDPNLNEFFKQVSPLALGFLLNVDHPKTYSASEWDSIEKNLSFLSKRANVTLSFNIHQVTPDYAYIFDLISKYNFKNLRLSFSMPVNFAGRKNAYLEIADYRSAAKYVMDFIRKAEALGAAVGMDNAVPICMFTPEQLSDLMLKQVIEPARNFVCYPAIDIGPDLSIWRCFGTSKLFNKKLLDFRSIEEICEYYQRVSQLYQFKYFPLKECEVCEHAKEKRCQGGCIGFAEAKIEELGIQISELTESELLAMIPKLSNKVTLRNYQLPSPTQTIYFQDGTEIEISPAMAEIVALFDGKTTVSQAIASKIQKTTLERNPDPLDDLLLDLTIQELLPIIRRLIDQKVLLA
jgi:MoaA/NifB/PqqE/SkfB family radical SAM enzyme